GLGSILFLLLFIIGSAASLNGRLITGAQYFSALLTLTAFAIAGVVGGGFSLYHSIRAILNKRSASFKLPWFWIFLILYAFVLGTGFALQANGQEVTSPALISFLIILAAIFPALALLALAVRRLHHPDWTTTWRRSILDGYEVRQKPFCWVWPAVLALPWWRRWDTSVLAIMIGWLSR